MKTYQDFQSAGDRIAFIRTAIEEYRAGETYRTAVIADEYEKQRNTTIRQYTKYLYTAVGRKVVDNYSSNNKICSNFFHRLNNLRCTYSLGNGVTFGTDGLKEQLGNGFDNSLYNLGYNALIHGVAYGFWNLNRLHVFPATEFCPLWDEDTGALRAGIRFWSLDWETRPVTAVLYEEDGYTVYKTVKDSTGLDLAVSEPKRGYVQQIEHTAAGGDTVVGEMNYSALPIIPLYGNRNRQSTLTGMREAIDSYDLIQSGFANDLQDCAQIYWIIDNAMGMDENDLARFMDKLKLQHIVAADDSNSKTTPYTQDIPYEGRKVYLDSIRQRIYEDFGALDVITFTGGQRTATEIEAAYEPMDEEADDFEYQIITFVRQLLSMIGVDDVPIFKRNRISNQREQTEMVMMAADYLDHETILKLLPYITVDQVQKIMEGTDREEGRRIKDEAGDE